MGHLIPTYNGKTVVINDLDLLIILGFALQIIDGSPQFGNLADLAAEWKKIPSLYGPGVIDLKIDDLVETPSQVRELKTLLETVLEQASQYGNGEIPPDVLNKMVIVPGVIFNNPGKVDFINSAVRQLQVLLAES
jgi:hypothetical protein